jgi:hypothetical protein
MSQRTRIPTTNSSAAVVVAIAVEFVVLAAAAGAPPRIRRNSDVVFVVGVPAARAMLGLLAPGLLRVPGRVSLLQGPSLRGRAASPRPDQSARSSPGTSWPGRPADTRRSGEATAAAASTLAGEAPLSRKYRAIRLVRSPGAAGQATSRAGRSRRREGRVVGSASRSRCRRGGDRDRRASHRRRLRSATAVSTLR